MIATGPLHTWIRKENPTIILNSLVACEFDAVVRARMVRKIGLEDVGDSANDAARVRVVLTGARDPFFSSFLDVDLAENMVVPEGLGWHDRYRVMFVVDVCHAPGKNGVHEAREVLVTNPGHAVPDDDDVGGWGQHQSKADTIEEGKRGAERMPYNRHHRTWVRLEQADHSLEHERRSPGG